MDIVSAFDGISCGQVALSNLGVTIDSYYASEIDPYAINICMKNFSNTIQLGDIYNVNVKDIKGCDLLIGGSPCQDFSNVKIQNGTKTILGLKGGKSKLFYEYYRLKKELSPKYFFLENVASMTLDSIKKISDILEVQPLKLNSSIFLPQVRNRLYWTNIPVDLEGLKNIKCENTVFDFLEVAFDSKYILSEKMKTCVMSSSPKWQHKPKIDQLVASPLTATMHKMHRAGIDNYYSCKAVEGKSDLRKLTPVECERLQGLPDNYTEGVSDTQRYRALGNCWNIPTIEYLFKGLL